MIKVEMYGISVGYRTIDTMSGRNVFCPQRLYENFFTLEKKDAEEFVKEHNERLEVDQENSYQNRIDDYWLVQPLILYVPE